MEKSMFNFRLSDKIYLLYEFKMSRERKEILCHSIRLKLALDSLLSKFQLHQTIHFNDFFDLFLSLFRVNQKQS